MSTIATLALEKLLKYAESAYGRNSTKKVIKLLFTTKSFPAYLAINTHAEKVSCHGELLLAEREGGILIKWDRKAGVQNQVEAITVNDAIKLSTFLGVTPRWDAVSIAESQLTNFLIDYPLLKEVIDLWRKGLRARGTTIADIANWIDAIRVIKTCKNSTTLDISVRKISTLLTFDSKRVELLWNIIDALLQQDINSTPRTAEEVFAELGIIKYPPTILISGDIQAHVTFHNVENIIKVERPYTGLAPSVITAFTTGKGPITLLTIENLTTFHELAAQSAKFENRILLYTGGMPSPSWKRVYRLILNALPVNSRVFHWGDIDVGGFRIAHHLALSCHEANKRLELHMMKLDKSFFKDKKVIRRDLSEKELSEISSTCLFWDWGSEQNWIMDSKVAIEQESLNVIWPHVDWNS